MTIVLVTVESGKSHSLREAVVTQVLVAVAQELVMSLSDEAETTAQTGQSVELRQCAGDNQVVVFSHQWCDIPRVHIHEAGIRLVNQYHGVRRDVLHDTTDLLTGQTVTRRIVRRGKQQHTGMHTVGVLNDLLHVIGEGVLQLMERIHLEGTATLTCHTVIIPPGELRDENLLVVTQHQEIVDGILQHVLTAISQQHLLLRYVINLTETYRDNTLLALVVDAGIETQSLWVEILDSLHHFLAGLKVKFVSVEIIHNILFFSIFRCCDLFYFHQRHADGNPDDLPHTADDAHEDAKGCG